MLLNKTLNIFKACNYALFSWCTRVFRFTLNFNTEFGKQVIIIGDRDGIPGPAIEECVKAAGSAEIVFSSTECFV